MVAQVMIQAMASAGASEGRLRGGWLVGVSEQRSGLQLQWGEGLGGRQGKQEGEGQRPNSRWSGCASFQLEGSLELGWGQW